MNINEFEHPEGKEPMWIEKKRCNFNENMDEVQVAALFVIYRLRIGIIAFTYFGLFANRHFFFNSTWIH